MRARSELHVLTNAPAVNGAGPAFVLRRGERVAPQAGERPLPGEIVDQAGEGQEPADQEQDPDQAAELPPGLHRLHDEQVHQRGACEGQRGRRGVAGRAPRGLRRAG
jgi:hypothetical protein